MKKFIALTAILFGCFSISYSQPGSLDPSFGDKGIVLTDFGTSTKNIYGASARQVLTQHDGNFYLIFEANGQTVIARILSNGIRDTSYGNNGYSQSVSILGAEGWSRNIVGAATGALQSDGKIVVAGSAGAYRYNTNGTFDSTFSEDGKQTTDFVINSLAIQSD